MAFIDDILAELVSVARPIIQSAIDQGRQEAVRQIMAAASAAQAAPASDDRNRGPEPVLPGIAPHVRIPPQIRERLSQPGSETARARKYPYGFVKTTVTDTLKANPNGLTRDQIGKAAHASTGVEIDDETLKNTLKAMLKKREAQSSNGNYFPGPALQPG